MQKYMGGGYKSLLYKELRDTQAPVRIKENAVKVWGVKINRVGTLLLTALPRSLENGKDAKLADCALPRRSKSPGLGIDTTKVVLFRFRRLLSFYANGRVRYNRRVAELFPITVTG
jgi:hypothetical protein